MAQIIDIYLRLNGSKAAVVDYAAQPTSTTPTITRNVKPVLHVHFFHEDNTLYSYSELSPYAFRFAAANDWNPADTPQLLVSSNVTVVQVNINASEVDAYINIPLSSTNTQELITAIGSSPSVTLGAELVGIADGNDAFVAQFDLVVTNRRYLDNAQPDPSQALTYINTSMLDGDDFEYDTITGKITIIGGGGAALSDAVPQALGTASAGTSAEASRADHVHAKPTKSDVGLGNVDNTSDTDKPISTATQAAFNVMDANFVGRLAALAATRQGITTDLVNQGKAYYDHYVGAIDSDVDFIDFLCVNNTVNMYNTVLQNLNLDPGSMLTVDIDYMASANPFTAYPKLAGKGVRITGNINADYSGAPHATLLLCYKDSTDVEILSVNGANMANAKWAKLAKSTLSEIVLAAEGMAPNYRAFLIPTGDVSGNFFYAAGEATAESTETVEVAIQTPSTAGTYEVRVTGATAINVHPGTGATFKWVNQFTDTPVYNKVYVFTFRYYGSGPIIANYAFSYDNV